MKILEQILTGLMIICVCWLMVEVFLHVHYQIEKTEPSQQECKQ